MHKKIAVVYCLLRQFIAFSKLFLQFIVCPKLLRHRNKARHIHPIGIYNDRRGRWQMPEIPLKISRAIIRKKARELSHNNLTGQGESVLCNFVECAPMRKGIEIPKKQELRY